uniref:Putative monolaris n=1 Tax=Amblyomma parvum TaxID=251391 RepID=A0A023G250_AMBPA
MFLYLLALNLFVAAWDHPVTLAEDTGIDYRCASILTVDSIGECEGEVGDIRWIYNNNNKICFSYKSCKGGNPLPDFDSENECLTTCSGH